MLGVLKLIFALEAWMSVSGLYFCRFFKMEANSSGILWMISEVGFAWAFQVCPSYDWSFLPMPWKAIHSAQWTAQSKNYEPNFSQISLTSKSTSLQQIATLVDHHPSQHNFLFFWRLFHISVSSQSPGFIPHLCHNFSLCSWRNTNCTSQSELHLQTFLVDIFL